MSPVVDYITSYFNCLIKDSEIDCDYIYADEDEGSLCDLVNKGILTDCNSKGLDLGDFENNAIEGF